MGGHGSIGQGSRIIVTSSDKQVLKNAEADEIYEVEEMNFQDSLQLFCLNAFKQNYPIETYTGLSEKILNYAKGIPLTLIVLGSLLCGRTMEEWQSELKKLEKLPELETYSVLKLTYDGLDDEQKEIFLDIACFYRGHEMNIVKQKLDSCGFSAAFGMRVLIDRCLISITNRKIEMHDLIKQMGQEIVCRQCVNDPGKRSRVWNHEDIYHVFKNNKGTDAIQCILVDICKIRQVELHAETFKMMRNLRMFHLYKSKLWASSKVSLPDICWNGLNNVHLARLTCYLDTFDPMVSPNIYEEPRDDVQLLNLDVLREGLPSLLPSLNELCWLDISHCESLTSLPIAHLSSLKSLDLSDCKELECIQKLPPFLKQLLAFDCPSIWTVSSSRFKLLPSDSEEGVFKFHLTNSQKLDPSAQKNIRDDACLTILQDPYKSVFFCFPGSAVPDWFPYQCEGHSITLNKDSLNWCSDDRFIGFALCVVLGVESSMDYDGRYDACGYRFRFEFDYGTHIIPNSDRLRCHFTWKTKNRYIDHDHTFMWKCLLESTGINYLLSHAHNFTFEINLGNHIMNQLSL